MDLGGGNIIHIFGCFYGIGIAILFNPKFSLDYKLYFSKKSSYVLAMIGTIFLWCYWPLLNQIYIY